MSDLSPETLAELDRLEASLRDDEPKGGIPPRPSARVKRRRAEQAPQRAKRARRRSVREARKRNRR